MSKFEHNVKRAIAYKRLRSWLEQYSGSIYYADANNFTYGLNEDIGRKELESFVNEASGAGFALKKVDLQESQVTHSWNAQQGFITRNYGNRLMCEIGSFQNIETPRYQHVYIESQNDAFWTELPNVPNSYQIPSDVTQVSPTLSVFRDFNLYGVFFIAFSDGVYVEVPYSFTNFPALTGTGAVIALDYSSQEANEVNDAVLIQALADNMPDYYVHFLTTVGPSPQWRFTNERTDIAEPWAESIASTFYELAQFSPEQESYLHHIYLHDEDLYYLMSPLSSVLIDTRKHVIFFVIPPLDIVDKDARARLGNVVKFCDQVGGYFSIFLLPESSPFLKFVNEENVCYDESSLRARLRQQGQRDNVW